MNPGHIFGLTALLGLAGAVALAQPADQTVSFATMPVGAPPSGFDFALTGSGLPGKWAVVGDESARGGKAVEQFDADATDYRFPLAILKQPVAKNLDVLLRFKSVSGKTDQAGGIAVRLRDANNYYVVRANALENNVRFYRVVNGNRRQIEGADVKVAPGIWHELGLRAEGNRFTIIFNDKTLYSATDQTFADPGRVSLWTKADSVTRFDSIRVAPLL
jgi:hypothetical protein